MESIPSPPKTLRLHDFLQVAGARIYYEVTGNGPPIFFLHGLSGNHLSWWQQVPYLSQKYTCVTLAQRGFPPSSEDADSQGPAAFGEDLAALVEHLGFGKIFLVAQSMGGFAVVEYAFQHPDKVGGMVLASTTGHLDDDTLVYPGLDEAPAFWQKSAETRQVLAVQGIEPAAGERMAQEQPALHYLYREIDDFTSKEFKSKIDQGLRKVPTRPLKGLDELKLPVLFIVGEEDVMFPAVYAWASASVISRAKVITVPRAGHSVYFERAAEFNRLVDEFFSGL